MPNQRNKIWRRFRIIAAIGAFFLVFSAAVFGGVYLVETSHANREATQSIKNGMTYSEVVGSLGVMYDRIYRGEYESTDEVIAKMENGESINFVCDWRIRFSLDMFYVGFDEHEVVVATMK